MSHAADTKHVVIVGGGFAGLAVAKKLAGRSGIRLTIVDRRNHHLFQPLLYQVATAGLSPAEIAAPIRSLLRGQINAEVVLDTVVDIDTKAREVHTRGGQALAYDYLVLAAGARHSYFGNDQWEAHAPGLKSLEEATEIRRRVLTAFELAERERDAAAQRRLLTFVVIGGGPTGVELAGALGEISRYTLSRDFTNIDPRRTRVILIEAGKRLLKAFDPALSQRATEDLERLGVTVWTSTRVSEVTEEAVHFGNERVEAATVLWAAGVRASELSERLGVERDRMGRVIVEADCSVAGRPEVFVIGDQAHFAHTPSGEPLPGLAPVATQQGRHVAANIRRELAGKERAPFRYVDKGQMATIGRKRAIVQFGRLRYAGFFAWLSWLFVHIYYLIGFKNRLFVLFSWAWSYFSFRRGARLIVNKHWRPEHAPPRPVSAIKSEQARARTETSAETPPAPAA